MLKKRVLVFTFTFVVMFVACMVLTIGIYRRALGEQTVLLAIWGGAWLGYVLGVMPVQPIVWWRRGDRRAVTDRQMRDAGIVMLVGLAVIMLLVE